MSKNNLPNKQESKIKLDVEIEMSKIHQKWLNFIVLINRIRFDSFNFLNYYLLRRLASGKNVPDIGQKFVRDCINAATLPGRAIKAGNQAKKTNPMMIMMMMTRQPQIQRRKLNQNIK